MKITGAKVFCGDNSFQDKDICVSGEFFSDDSSDEVTVDARGCYVIPGLIDIHFHGAMGADVCDGTIEAFEKVAEYELKRGVTSICPATLTLAATRLKEILKTGAEFAAKGAEDVSEILGFNMEGPFISREKKGAQNADYIIQCDSGVVDEFIEASSGLLKIIGLAPEENPDFEGYIKDVRDKVKVSLAHTGCDYDTACRAFAAGASHAVHLYNAMTGMNHRQPGVVGAVADNRNVTAELICDGVHIHPAVVRTTIRMLGADRVVMISDSLRCAGMPDGIYDLGGQKVERNGKFCRLAGGGSIAGSVSDLMDCLVCAVREMNIPLETAVRASTINPARVLGVDDMYGEIETGKFADMVLLDMKELSIRGVYKKGKRVV